MSLFARAVAASRRIAARKPALMKRSESWAARPGLFFQTQRVTDAGESPTQAGGAANAGTTHSASTAAAASLSTGTVAAVYSTTW